MNADSERDGAAAGTGNGSANNHPNTNNKNKSTKSSTFLAPTTSSVMKKHEVSASSDHAGTGASSGGPETTKPRGLTVPHSPKFRSKSSKDHVLTKEEREAQEIEALRQAEAARIEANKKAYEKLKNTANIAAKTAGATRSTKQLTIPETPMHNLVNRLGAKEQQHTANAGAMGSTSGSAASGGAGDVKKSLNFDAAGQPHHTQLPKGPTMPQPFNFATTKRFGDPVMPPAPPAAASTTATSASASGGRDRGASPSAGAAAGHRYTGQPTIPTAPVFATEKRAQSHSYAGSTVLSTEEREKLMMEEFKRNPFKAKPVDKGVLAAAASGVGAGVHAPAPPKLTEPKPFNLAIDKRIPVVNPATAAGSSPERASSPPRSAQQGPYQPTIPVSPHFHGKSKLTASYAAHLQASPSSSTAHGNGSASAATTAAPTSAGGAGAGAGTGAGHLTKPQPFRLLTSDRGALYKELLQLKIKEEAEAEAARHETKNAYVTPVPTVVRDSSKVFHPMPSMKQPTTISEFHLTSKQKHEDARNKLAAKLKAESAAAAAEREYRARPCPSKILQQPDFVSHRASEGVVQVIAAAMSDIPSATATATATATAAAATVVVPPRPKIKPAEVTLHTADRASQRTAFESSNAARLSVAEAAKNAAKAAKEEAEARELQHLRRLSVDEGGFCFKAKPVGSKHRGTTAPSALSNAATTSTNATNDVMRSSINSNSSGNSSAGGSALRDLSASASSSFPFANPVTSKSFTYFTPMTQDEVDATTKQQQQQQQQQGENTGNKDKNKSMNMKKVRAAQVTAENAAATAAAAVTRGGKENKSNTAGAGTAGTAGTATVGGLRSKPQRLGMPNNKAAAPASAGSAASASASTAAAPADEAEEAVFSTAAPAAASEAEELVQ